MSRSAQPNHLMLLAVEALGVPVEMRISGAHAERLRDELERAWSRCLLPPGSAGRVTVDVDASRDVPDAAQSASSDVTVAAIGERAGSLWMLHAAGITAPDGRTVALVAPSGTGKTTAAAHLCRRWGYLSDETVGIAADGRVVAYPKPLSVRESAEQPKRQVSPDELGLLMSAGNPRISKIVLLTRKDDLRSTVISVPTGAALVQLAAQSSYLRTMPSPLQIMAGHLANTGGALAVQYSDVNQLDDVMDEVLS